MSDRTTWYITVMANFGLPTKTQTIEGTWMDAAEWVMALTSGNLYSNYNPRNAVFIVDSKQPQVGCADAVSVGEIRSAVRQAKNV